MVITGYIATFNCIMLILTLLFSKSGMLVISMSVGVIGTYPILAFFVVRGLYSLWVIHSCTILPKSIKYTDLLKTKKINLRDYKIKGKHQYYVILDGHPSSNCIDIYNEIVASNVGPYQEDDLYITKHDNYQNLLEGPSIFVEAFNIERDENGNRVLSENDMMEVSSYFN